MLEFDIVGDARKMPIPNNWIFKEVRAVYIMEHFCHPKYSSKEMRKKYGTTFEVVKECYRVLKPGGKLKIVNPVKLLFSSWRLKWNTSDTPGNKDWHNIEWYHWLFWEGQK